MNDLFAPTSEALDVDILVLPDVSLLCFASTIEPLRAANRVSARPIYRWRLLSADGAPVLTSSGLPVPVHGAFDPGTVPGALIVVASFNVFQHSTPALLAGLRRVARRGVPLGGVEAGAWTLALAGLLDGRRATTHWEDLDEFAARFPSVEVRPDRFVVDGPRFTTGGASPALDMMLHLIRSRQGYALALDVASIFIYDQSRAPEDPQPVVSLGRLGWHEPRVSTAIRLMEERIERPIAIPAIARRAGVSARALETLFLRTVGLSPRDYYLALRLNAGRRLVLETLKSVTEISAITGFGSASAFARSFRSRFGESPREARRRRALDAGPTAPHRAASQRRDVS
jgi:transcriptional regulator GlxA family with amidase domain